MIEIDAAEKFDGISAVTYDPGGRGHSAAVVTRRGVPGERQRLSLAHELGHLTLKIPEAVDQETAAFRFGVAFWPPRPWSDKRSGERIHPIPGVDAG